MTDNNSKTKKIRFVSKELKRMFTISGIFIISLSVVTSIFLVKIFTNNILLKLVKTFVNNINNSNNSVLLETDSKNKKINLFFDNKITNFELTEDIKTVGDVLKSTNCNNCICNYNLDTPVRESMNILIKKVVSVNIQDSNKSTDYFIPENISIKKALELLKINLSEYDNINFDTNENIYEDMNIIIDRIDYNEFTYVEPVEYSTITKKDYTLEKNSRKIISEGQNGERESKIKRKIVNGEITETETLSNKILKPAKERVILVGAKPEKDYNKNTKNTADNISNTKSEVIKTISGYATAYTDSGGIIRKNGRVITSTGKIPQEGITVAVNPTLIPYGSKIRVRTTDGLFDRVLYAQDTGGALKSGTATVDIYMKNKKDCLNFGRRKVEVSLLK